MLAPRNAPPALVEVVAIWRRQMHDLHSWVGEEVVDGVVGPRNGDAFGGGAATLRRRTEHADDVMPEPADRLDMEGADEPGPDDGGAEGGHDYLRLRFAAFTDLLPQRRFRRVRPDQRRMAR